MSVLPPAAKANARLLAGDQTKLRDLAAVDQRLKALAADPAYDHPANRQRLAALQADVDSRKATLTEEARLRSDLDDAYRVGDKDRAKVDRAALAQLRADNAGQYGKASTVAVCAPCLLKKVNAVKAVRTPQDSTQASDLITGVFEGREPDYCAVADSATDAGGLSYGKHQAAEKKGGLYKMLSAYSAQIDPAPDPKLKTAIDAQLAKFSTPTSYDGTDTDRVAFKSTLKQACSDPAMRKTQDDFFKKEYMDPAMASAGALCVTSPLGQSMLYDLSIQSGPGRIKTLAPKAMTSLKSHATQCSPCDPDGPRESDFLKALNEERRKYVTSLGGDAAKSTYREDFYAAQIEAENLDLSQDFLVKGLPVRGLPQPAPTPVTGQP